MRAKIPRAPAGETWGDAMYRKRLLKIFLHMARQAVENSPYRFMGLTRRIGEIIVLEALIFDV
jgi:hypothetical protein